MRPKSGNSNTTNGREMAWSVSTSLPENICRNIQVTGGGACGFNSVCSMDGGTVQRPRCSCPVGYSPIDPQDWKSGCKQDFIPQKCGQENDSFSFVEMTNTDFPLNDHAAFVQVDEEWCRRACLADCFCSVAIYRDNYCWMKSVPFLNGRTDPTTGGKALIKIRNNSTVDHSSSGWSSRKSSTSSTLIIIGSVLLGGSVLANLLVLASVFLFGFRFNGKKTKSRVHPGLNIRSFSFNELQVATNEFKEELGSGACSTVYKGALNDENGRLIAVKKLLKVQGGVEQEFIAEVSSISRTNHKNLVRLLGYCDEGQNKLLVYEFMSNGSLASFLFESSTRPNWYRRVQIAFATARGLCYLHEECSTQIIHCDIKPQNVLLDDSHTPKISDFGLAKLLRPDQTRTTTGIRGTRGYVAPEWFRNMPITVKVDVYSFGILLLELVCCRKSYEADVDDEREAILADWAYDCYKDGTLSLLVAHDEEARDDMNLFEKFVKIAIWCTQEDPALRPQMKRVMHMLEGSVQVPSPPDPASFIG